MTARILLQRMCPMGVFTDWSEEDIRSQIVMMLVIGRAQNWPQRMWSPYWRN